MGYHSCYILVILLYIAMIVYSESTKQHPYSTNHAHPRADFSLHLPMSQLKDGRDKKVTKTLTIERHCCRILR